LGQSGRITGSLATPAFPYLAVYYLEIIGVVVTVLLMIPLLRRTAQETEAAGKASPLELAEYLA
jgi:hypothetical protein